MNKGFLFISCDEAKHICDKAQYNDASGWEKIKLNIRLSWCRITRAYYKRNAKLTEAIEKSNVACLDAANKDAMKSDFENELKKHSV